MTALPGLTWEYICFNIDLPRLRELTEAWKKHPRECDTLKSLENMLEQYGGFKRVKKKRLSTNKDEAFDLVSFDPAKWKVISKTRM